MDKLDSVKVSKFSKPAISSSEYFIIPSKIPGVP